MQGTFSVRLSFLLIYILIGPFVKAQEAKAYEMIRISAGEFEMGGDASLGDAQPKHKVLISKDFLIGKYEVTNELYSAVVNFLIDEGEYSADRNAVWNTKTRQFRLQFVDDMPYYHQFGLEYHSSYIHPVQGRGEHPVVGVSWHGALEFCNGLSRMQGLEPAYDVIAEKWIQGANGYRLPTEAEWEYAAGSGQNSPFPWGDSIDSSVANYSGSENPFAASWPNPWENGGPTTPVGFFNGQMHDKFKTRSNASRFGAFDMSGNVYEWCWDTYQRDYYASSPSVDPLGPPAKLLVKVTRGGSWRELPENLRVFERRGISAFSYADDVGLRLARSIRK